MNEPLKPRIDFSRPDAISAVSPTLQEKQHFADKEIEVDGAAFDQEAQEQDLRVEEQQQNEQLLNQIFHPRRSWGKRLWQLSLALISVGAIAQAVHWFIQVWQQQQWIALTFALAILLLIITMVVAFIVECWRAWHLRQRYDERQQAEILIHSLSYGKAKPFCEKLLQQSRLSATHPAVQRWRNQLHDSQNDSEVMQLYAESIQKTIDKQAKQLISYYAAESALMIAISPFALIDMLFIAWRNLRLINQLAKLYAIPLGYFSRLALFRLVVINIAFAGATELVREMGVDWLSQDLTARLSARAAQGIGAGLLTARLGIKAMELCRPLPWLTDERPRLADFRYSLYQQLKKVLTKKSVDVDKG